MDSGTFFAQDLAGNRQQIRIVRDPAAQDGSGTTARVSYVLEDGSPLRRIDNDTFQIVGTGAFITLMRD